jgi:hypothetical protein
MLEIDHGARILKGEDNCENPSLTYNKLTAVIFPSSIEPHVEFAVIYRPCCRENTSTHKSHTPYG